MKSRIFEILLLFVICAHSNAMVLDQNSLNKKLFEVLDQNSEFFNFSSHDKELVRELLKSGANVQARGREHDENTVDYLFFASPVNLVAVSLPISKLVGYYD